MRPSRVFISYTHADADLVDPLRRALSRLGLVVWRDREKLRSGDSQVAFISQAIADGDFVIAIVSPAALKSKWCKFELDIAATLSIENERAFVLPVRYRKSTMPNHLRHLHWLDGDALDVSTLATRITNDIARHRGIAELPSKVDDEWMRTALAVFDSEPPRDQERWKFHLKSAALAGRASVKIDGSYHYHTAERLMRLGALSLLKTLGPWRFYTMTDRGHQLLDELDSVGHGRGATA